ncbi:hypothetical protein LSUB1_G001780 [Lachnellula subtilissima]|uniref:SnoaL-like domain-containing protein n=1 Tax=Lachnellula subtilissima TaxID=602034 RepID=A0A8H8RXU6_9HELO|nr:hypothetical protein LSUB1_G001780 [Lachnellula subtilissima]
MPYQQNLTSLTTREAITDALYRAIIGFDRNDIPMFMSACAGEDLVFEIHNGEQKELVSGTSVIRDTVLATVGPMDTQHITSNIRIDYKDGADTASLTAHAQSQHWPPGKGREPDAPNYLVGGEYLLDLVRDDADGLWKIKYWVLKAIWTQGDPSVMGRH